MLRRPVPLYLSFILFFILAAGFIAGIFVFEEKIYKYSSVLGSIRKYDTGDFKTGVWPELKDPEFFKKVKQGLIDEKTDFIESDLSEKMLRVYSAGLLVKEVPILAIGKKGSWWETPAGLYRIETKEKNHFSTFGEVYQPWSMSFQGNFFIHGWPYYPDGTEVVSTYSGGCIRLNTEDAKQVYELSARGMPVLVHESGFEQDVFAYKTKIPDISATNYLAADLKSNYVFLEKEANESTSVASLTKLLTALTVSEYLNLENKLTVRESDLATTSVPRLEAGDVFKAMDLFYPLLMESSNEAALVLSRAVGRDRFMGLINDKVEALGMEGAYFVDPAGVSADNKASAKNIFSLAKFLYNNKSFVLKVSSSTTNSSVLPKAFKNLNNFNLIDGVSGFFGGKIGKSTAAGETMLAIFEIEFSGRIRPIAVIVLGSNDAKEDVRKIINYVKSSYLPIN